MFEAGTYTIAEMREIFKSDKKQAIDRKLKRYGIDFTVSGSGEKAVYTIAEITDPFIKFKVLCITELDFNAGCDFERLKFFMLYFFDDENFQKLPFKGMEEAMELHGMRVARKTIKNWMEKIEAANFINRGGEYTYYSVKKDMRKEISHECYSAAWAAYWKNMPNKAISAMLYVAGGYPRKVPKVSVNAFHADVIDEMLKLIRESIDMDIAAGKI